MSAHRSAINRILARLGDVRETPEDWSARCPVCCSAHSLAIDGFAASVRIHCGGDDCPAADILEAVGLDDLVSELASS
jgi:hypothetical protein